LTSIVYFFDNFY